MKSPRSRVVGLAVALLTAILTSIGAVAARAGGEEPRPGVDWPGFRGIRASGVADGFPTATTFDAASGAGVKWKAQIEGLAHSSPVVWGNDLFLTTAVAAAGAPDLKVGLYGDVRSAA